MSRQFKALTQSTLTNCKDETHCPLHNQRLRLICYDHQVLICDECALFGNHQGHRIITSNQLIQQNFTLSNSLKSLIEQLKGQESFKLQYAQQAYKNKLQSAFQQTSKQLKIKYQKALFKLDKLFKQSIQRISFPQNQSCYFQQLFNQQVSHQNQSIQTVITACQFLKSNIQSVKIKIKNRRSRQVQLSKLLGQIHIETKGSCSISWQVYKRQLSKSREKSLSKKNQSRPKTKSSYGQKSQILDLSNKKLSDQDIVCKLSQKRLAQVQILNLSRNNITNEGFQSILIVIQGSQIKTLNLCQNRLTAQCLQILTACRPRHLRTLNLSKNGIALKSIKDSLKLLQQQGLIVTY